MDQLKDRFKVSLGPWSWATWLARIRGLFTNVSCYLIGNCGISLILEGSIKRGGNSHWHVTSTTDFTATRTHPSPLSSTCRRFLKKTLKCSLSSSNIGLSLDHTNKSQNIFGISFSLFHFRHIYFKLEIYARCQIRIKKTSKNIFINLYMKVEIMGNRFDIEISIKL